MTAITPLLSRVFNGIETADLFIKPAITGQPWLDVLTVRPNITSKEQLNFRDKLGKATRRFTQCSFDPITGITLTDKVLDVNPMKVDLEECVFTLRDTIFEAAWAKTGTAIVDLTGTEVERIMRDMLVETTRRDTARGLWWGDTTVGSLDYNGYDGFWKLLINGTASLDGSIDMTDFETNSVLDTDAALDVFEAMWNELDATTREFGTDLRIWTTLAMGDNYRATLRNLSTDSGFATVLDGPPRMAFNNIEILEVPEWGVDIADASNGLASSLRTTTNNVAILSIGSNFFIGTDAVGAAKGTDAEIWFSQDNRTIRANLNYKIGTQIPFLELVVAAF